MTSLKLDIRGGSHPEGRRDETPHIRGCLNLANIPLFQPNGVVNIL